MTDIGLCTTQMVDAIMGALFPDAVVLRTRTELEGRRSGEERLTTSYLQLQ